MPSWLSGYWTGEQRGTQMEELWFPAKGPLMIGMHRDHFPSGKTFFEFLRIENSANGLVYIAQPRGGKATAFPLKTLSEHELVFENLEHDFPQRIGYGLHGQELVVFIEGERNGKIMRTEWRWQRTEFPAEVEPKHDDPK